jgi:hypothetical protein
LAWLNWDGTGFYPLWKIVSLSLFALFSIAVYPLFIKFSNFILLKQFKKHGLYEGLTGERRLLTGEDRLRVETEISIFELYFTAINKIIMSDQSLFLWRNQNVYIIVSLSAFPNLDQRNEFLDLLREKTPAVFLQVGKNLVEHRPDLDAALAIDQKSARA